MKNIAIIDIESQGASTSYSSIISIAGILVDSNLKEIVVPDNYQSFWRVEEEFISAIRGKELITHTPFETGVKYMEFTEAARKSANSGERIDLSI